jgi:lipid-A-disaccharide synthase-like uncharacterized protein
MRTKEVEYTLSGGYGLMIVSNDFEVKMAEETGSVRVSDATYWERLQTGGLLALSATISRGDAVQLRD